MQLVGVRLGVVLAAAVAVLSLPACAALPVTPANSSPTSQEHANPSPPPPSPPQPTPAPPVAEPTHFPDSPGVGNSPEWAVERPLVPGQTGGVASNPPGPWDRLRQDWDLGKDDYANFYSGASLAGLVLGIGLAAPLANTSADRSIDHWYQSQVKGKDGDPLAAVVTNAAQHWIIAPACLEVAGLTGHAGEGYATDGGLFEWSNRSLRAAAVGYPLVLLGGVALGASRPGQDDSRWHPFQDTHGISGHTFIGAVPFLTAASMTDSPYLQAPLILGSFLTGWARIHDDQHYFSQVALGWLMAYLSVRAVNQTQGARSSVSVVPMFGPAGPGVALHVVY